MYVRIKLPFIKLIISSPFEETLLKYEKTGVKLIKTYLLRQPQKRNCSIIKCIIIKRKIKIIKSLLWSFENCWNQNTATNQIKPTDNENAIFIWWVHQIHRNWVCWNRFGRNRGHGRESMMNFDWMFFIWKDFVSNNVFFFEVIGETNLNFFSNWKKLI